MRKHGDSLERTKDLRNRNTADHYGFGFPTGKKTEKMQKHFKHPEERCYE